MRSAANATSAVAGDYVFYSDYRHDHNGASYANARMHN